MHLPFLFSRINWMDYGKIFPYYFDYTVLLRDNVASACNLFRVTSLFDLIESASVMRISLHYQPIEVNADIATESYATECNCKDKATQIRNFVVSQA